MNSASARAAAAARPPVASFRLRILFRGVFLLLALATIALALVLLHDEKQRSYRNYEQDLRKTQADVLARLRQPSGMLALLNPGASGMPPLQPLVLPFPALNFADPNRVHQSVDQAGCSVRYPDGSTLCVAVGGTASAAGLLYVVGSFQDAFDLVEGNGKPIEAIRRAHIQLTVGDDVQSWTTRFEPLSAPDEPLVRGRILGFDASDAEADRPLRDFRGLWQSTTCVPAGRPPDCARRVLYAMQLPARAFRERRAAGKSGAGWPPAALHTAQVRVVVTRPGETTPLFDSHAIGAEPPAGLGQAVQSLRPGETLTISRHDVPEPAILLKGSEAALERSSPLLLQLVGKLPVRLPSGPIALRDTVVTPVASYEVRLTGDPRTIDRGLGAVATRISWYVSGMLAAILLAWLGIEVGLIRRITALSRRAAVVSRDVRGNVRGGERIGQLEVSDLRGTDELGILAGGLADLLQRVKDDVDREELRARQEREMLEAVGHEILSPLQSLMVLFPDPADPAYRYVQRMRQAVGALYGQASPREALEAARLDLVPVDLDEFLFHVASNAAFAGIDDVRYQRLGKKVMVRADEYPLEDVVTHILRNADRHRAAGTPITLSLDVQGKRARVRIHNVGAPIDEALLGRIFDYGVRDADDAEDAESQGRRGQGLFVARTYMAKMGGAVRAGNEDAGVAFYLELPLAAP